MSMVSESYPCAAMISATNGLEVESQPLMTGLPPVQRSRMPFLIIWSILSKGDLRKLDIHVVENAFTAAFAAHAARLDAAEGSFGGGEGKAVDTNHAGFNPCGCFADA